MASSTRTPEGVHFDCSSIGRSSSSGRNRAGWPARRHTPYTKTPRSRRLQGKSNKLVRTPMLPRDDSHSLKQLLKKTWHVYQTTPLYKFKHSATALRSYSKHLSASLQAESQKGIGVDLESELGDRAVFSLCNGLKTSSDDAEAVELTIKVKGQVDTSRVIFNAILCSVGTEHTDQLADEFTVLPVLMVKGTSAVTRYVITWLQAQFDCHIKRMTFNPMDLVWMLSMWAGSYTGDQAKTLELVYTPPKHVQVLNRITLTIDSADAKKLWESVHDDATVDFTNDEVAAFIKALEAHFFHHFRIHLSAMTLSRIGTPSVYVGSDGRLKLLSEESIHTVLQHITELMMDNSANAGV